MRSFFFFPPLPKISGGMMVLAELARILKNAHYDTFLVTQERKSLEKWAPDVPIVDLNNVQLTSTDRWIVPEGWLAPLTFGLTAHAQCLIYVQNWAYLHGYLPQGILWQHLPVRMLAVSYPVAYFIQETCGISAEILRPSIDLDLFHPNARSTFTPEETVRIAWMPRKNKALAKQIQDIFEARLALRGLKKTEWIEIHGRSHQEVAEMLRSSHIFLATGFPEGCPLPPLEALASGCLLVGFTGFGGWDYMRQSQGFLPEIPLQKTEWSDNGFFVSDGDVFSAALALEKAVNILYESDTRLANLYHSAALTVNLYSKERQKQMLLTLWKDDVFWKKAQH